MNEYQIRKILLANGFTVKEGQADLKPYVYKAARELLDTNQRELGLLTEGREEYMREARVVSENPGAALSIIRRLQRQVDELKSSPAAQLIAAMKADPEYAWSWHCNIAMAFVDEGGSHTRANHAAARFLRLFAGIEPAYELPAKPVAPSARTTSGDDDLILVRRDLVGAACAAIARQHPAPKTLDALRAVSMSDAVSEVVRPVGTLPEQIDLTPAAIRPAPEREELTWGSTTPAYRAFITDSVYQRLDPKFQKWYRPVPASQRATAEEVLRLKSELTAEKRRTAALQASGSVDCELGNRCNCGGDVPAVRAGCSNWVGRTDGRHASDKPTRAD